MSFQQLDSARSMRAEIEAAGLAAEDQCQVSSQLIQKLNDQDLFAMTIPRIYGGAQLEALDTLQVIEELAYADSAVGWCGMIYSTTAVLGSFLPEHWAQKVYGPQGEEGRNPISRWCSTLRERQSSRGWGGGFRPMGMGFRLTSL